MTWRAGYAGVAAFAVTAALACAPATDRAPDSQRSGGPALASQSDLDSAARRVVGFLQGRATFEDIVLADSVKLLVSPEGGGASRVSSREDLRNPARWVVQTGRARYAFAPGSASTRITTRVGRHFNCFEYPLSSRFPDLALWPHVGVKLEPLGASSCLQTWNVTFVFDSARPPRVIAAVLDRFEW